VACFLIYIYKKQPQSAEFLLFSLYSIRMLAPADRPATHQPHTISLDDRPSHHTLNTQLVMNVFPRPTLFIPLGYF
jgi:hypothetical protein